MKGIALFFATWSSLHVLSRTYETFVLFCKRGKQAWGARRQHVCHVVKQLSRYLKTCETCKLSNALSPKPLACLWYATKIPSSSFWHLLYNNHQWKISNWSEIISWCTFAQSRLYAYLKKPFPEITIICDQDDNSLSLCFKSMYRTLFVAIFTSDFIFSMFKSSHTYRNINISNHPQQGGKEQKQLLTGDNAYNFQGCIRNKFSMMVRLFFISVRMSDGLKAMKS